ncbi:MAG: phytanoyl-CoA dioxygenase family protein [Sphingomonadales bacterium]|nr:phytanoyl-CoA dioxygenase family protein [Sphingomonadales bacterium]
MDINIHHCTQNFWRDGYLHLPGFFAPALMDRLDELITDYFGAEPAFWHTDEFLSASQTEVVPWFPQNEGVATFDEIDADPRFYGLTEAILGQGWTRHYCMVMFSKKGTVGQAWHQDCPPEDAAAHNLNRLVYTSDITDAIGGQVVLVPGSHRAGLLPPGDPHADLAGQRVLTPAKGDLVFLHGHTWHRVLPIREKYRFSTNYRAAPKGTPDDITDVCVYRNMRYRFSTEQIIEERTPAA